jgi:hypothetical protein
VTGEDGTFELRGLPAGTCTIEAWHEDFGRQMQQVTLSGSSPSATTGVHLHGIRAPFALNPGRRVPRPRVSERRAYGSSPAGCR